jgi:hypothetical protein
MAEILSFRTKDAAIDPDVVLKEATGKYESVILIGWNHEELLDFRASLNLTQSEIN